MGLFGKSPEEKQAEAAIEAKANNIILTTTDLHRDYIILDIVISDEMLAENQKGYADGKHSLKKRAAEIGADAVIGVHCFLAHDISTGCRRWYGTAVRFK